MVRILHTADVHLAPGADERREALESVLAMADAENVDVLTVGGDLFDSELAAERLRETLRTLFSERDYPIVTIPGNHDVGAFDRNVFFGEDFVPATETPFDHFVVGDGQVRLTYLPYTPQPSDDLLAGLANREPFAGPECLLLHCSLEAPITGDVGDEGERRYFPVTKGELAELDFEYYLAGHYHSSHVAELSNGGTFVYPGTPASVTRTETGRRTAMLVDTDASGTIQPRSLETFHYDRLTCRVTPGDEEAILDRVRSAVADWGGRPVSPEITVDGFTEWDETAFDTALSTASGDVPVRNATRSAAHVLSHPLFVRFREELEARERLHAVEEHDEYDVDRFQRAVRERTLEVFVDLAAEGTLP